MQMTLIEYSAFFVKLEPPEFLTTNWSKKNSAILAPNILRYTSHSCSQYVQELSKELKRETFLTE